MANDGRWQGTFCNEHTYQCFLTDVHAACCDEGGLNCPDGQDIPNTCPVGCAIIFPSFLETCRDHVREQAGLEEADYESFEQQCECSHPPATTQHTNRAFPQPCPGCLLRDV